MIFFYFFIVRRVLSHIRNNIYLGATPTQSTAVCRDRQIGKCFIGILSRFLRMIHIILYATGRGGKSLVHEAWQGIGQV